MIPSGIEPETFRFVAQHLNHWATAVPPTSSQYWLTYLLHGADSFLREISSISRNSKFHYRTHKRPPPVSILGQPNPVHIPTSHLLEIHPNVIHPSTPRSPQWSLPLRFPHQDPIHPPLLTHTRHMPSPSHSSRFYHPHIVGGEVHKKWNKTASDINLVFYSSTNTITLTPDSVIVMYFFFKSIEVLPETY